MKLQRSLAAMALVGMLAAACGGTPAATQAPGAATQDPAVPATMAPQGTPTTAPVETQPGGGGGGGTAETACDLLTAEEAATNLGTGALTATPDELAGQTFCDYRLASAESVLTTYMQTGGAQMWSVFESSLTTDPVSGLGDKAMFEPSTKLLFVLKGDTLFNVFAADITLDAAAALELEKKLAAVMVAKI